MIEIKSISGETLLKALISEDAISHEELMVSDYIQMRWDSDKCVELPLGAYIMRNEEKYSLLEPYVPSRQSDGAYRYSPLFHSSFMRWQKIIVPVYTYSNGIDSRELDWDFVGAPSDAMYMVTQTLRNELGEEWNVSIADGLPESITISGKSSSIWTVLSDIAEQCSTEWWVDKASRWLYLSKCSRGVSVTLEVGKDVSVPTVTKNVKEYFTRFYALGSTRNITQIESSVQGSMVSRRLTLDPDKYPDGYKDIKGHFSGGVFVSDLAPEEILTKSLYFEDIYPSSQLSISSVRKRLRYELDDNGNKIVEGMTEVTEEGTEPQPIYKQYAIWYFQLPDFEFKEDLIIEGKELSVAFKTGQLAGREFALTYHDEEKKVADKADVDPEFTVLKGEYEINFEQNGTLIIPSVDYIIPKEGDEVILFNIDMPDEYKQSAYLLLESKLNEEMAELTKDNDNYEFNSNPILFHEEEKDLYLGQNIHLINGSHTVDARVLMVEKHLDYPCVQKARIGNMVIKGSRQQLSDEVRNVGREISRLNKFEETSSSVQNSQNRDLMMSMSRYMAIQDTIDMLEGAFDNFTEGISPITVETMTLLIGNESLQFRFTASRSNLTPINCPLVYDSETKQLNASAAALIHLTLGFSTITAKNVKSASEYKSWDMEEWHSAILEDATKRYYVYAQVERNGTAGTYVLSENAIDMRADDDYYFLLVGTLNSEYAGTRELVTLYGFTEILPSQVTTDTITSVTNKLIIDLVNAKITAKDGATIEGAIRFTSGSSGLENLDEWEDVQGQIDSASQNAQDALDVAQNAQQEAEEAQKEMQSWLEDGVISPVEKVAIRNERAGVMAEYEDIIADCERYSIDNANLASYKDGYTKYLAQLDALLATDTVVDADTALSYQASYYSSRTAILKDIAQAAKAFAQDAKDIANAANAAVEILDGKMAGFESDVEDINRRLDGVVIQHVGEYVPSLSNEPYISWTTDEEKINHIGDVFTNISDLDEDADNAGKSWRWCACSDDDISKYDYVEVSYDGKTYKLHWHPIADSDAAKALAEAASAKDLADGKRRNFVEQPYPPYDKGDMWMEGSDGDIWVCETPRTKGELFYSSDWVLASKYTDDTTAQEALERLESVKSSLEQSIADAEEAAKGYTDEGQAAMLEAIDALNDAKANVEDVYEKSVADGKISAAEQNAIDKAEAYASAAQANAETNAAVYADGVAYAAEENALAAANANLEVAKKELEEALAALEQRVSDAAYLTDALKEGDAIVDGGLIMASMVAVGDTTVTEANVEAFLNGSTFAEDTDNHGKLILAGGIPTETEDGSTDLEARANEASTRIYEDGTTYTNSLILEEGCTVGAFEVDTYGNLSLDGCSKGTGTSTYVYTDGFEVAGVKNVDMACHILRRLRISAAEDADAFIVIEDDRGEAIRVVKGMLAGLRPKSRTINSSTSSSLRYLDEFDHTIFMNGNITVYLPSSPLEGQEYVILTSAGGTLNGNGKKIFLFANGSDFSSLVLSDLGSSRVELRLYWHKAEGKWWAQHTAHNW